MTTGRGKFIVLEGIDGCGKTTQANILAEELPKSGLMPPGAKVIQTSEPGGTPFGQALRQLLLHPPEAAAPCSVAELLLYAADRAQHVERVIRPALERGDWVVSDRFAVSTLAYQGYGRGLDRTLITQLEQIATGGLKPDFTFWLQIPVQLSLDRRANQADDRIEAAGQGFLQRVCDGYDEIGAERRLEENWWAVDATCSEISVAREICVGLRLLLRAAQIKMNKAYNQILEDSASYSSQTGEEYLKEYGNGYDDPLR
jgi:dTMP kinase